MKTELYEWPLLLWFPLKMCLDWFSKVVLKSPSVLLHVHPFSSAFTWSYLINMPLMLSRSIKSNAEYRSPAEVLPLSKQSFLCAWNWRGQHSSLQASNKDPNSCRNNPDSHWECKPIRCTLGSLPPSRWTISVFVKPSWCQQVQPAALTVLLPELCTTVRLAVWELWII